MLIIKYPYACIRGWQGQVAYGCQNLVVVVDPTTVQVIQTLDRHKGYVVKVSHLALGLFTHTIATGLVIQTLFWLVIMTLDRHKGFMYVATVSHPNFGPCC